CKFAFIIFIIIIFNQDMTGKMFTFPQETNTALVRLNTVFHSFASSQGHNIMVIRLLSYIHRSFTDLKRDHSLFSLASPANQNEVLIFYDSSKKLLAPYLHNVEIGYGELDYVPNKWHSICTTWNSKTGLGQLWFNGLPMTKKFAGSTINGKPSIILGQEQDSYGSHFDAKQSFVGMMTDVHMWDHEITPCEIQKYAEELSFTPGNVINWAALDFKAEGNVFVESKQVGCNSVCLL
uniref:Pentraxin family member n=1 Tax=Neogobius melanostomus TaxID=47308 RepID=A0A8C6TCY4_9GOBI